MAATVYAQDVQSQLEETQDGVTSIYRHFFKMDSMKKVSITGVAASMVALSTNVWNEFGQVLISILIRVFISIFIRVFISIPTAGEGEGQLPMCVKLMEWYQRAGLDPPQLNVDQEDVEDVGRLQEAPRSRGHLTDVAFQQTYWRSFTVTTHAHTHTHTRTRRAQENSSTSRSFTPYTHNVNRHILKVNGH
ncbi:uncharacterized protein LOC143509993 [Brachyhypopomus gauderio]|uniref:uncharacterized protein LOC143509993 n=1 Tax=Brachyhypopomus gauderio TaxID=698409 RepID=UPI004041A01D